MSRKLHWVFASNDSKTGKVLASYSPKSTCPDTCSLKEGGCYAWGLFYLRILGDKIENTKFKLRSLKEALPKRKGDCKIARHRIAGDIVGDVEETLEEIKLIEEEGLINIGYTHHWKSEEAAPLKPHFRASCQSIEEMNEAHSMGWSVALMVPEDTPKSMRFEDGKRGFVCPARHGVEGKKDITCNTCTLCRVDDRTKDKVVMFKIHGTKSTLNQAREKISL